MLTKTKNIRNFFFQKFKEKKEEKRPSVWPRESTNQNLKEIHVLGSETIWIWIWIIIAISVRISQRWGVGALQLWAGGGCQAVPKAQYGIRLCGTVRERVPLGHGIWGERVRALAPMF